MSQSFQIWVPCELRHPSDENIPLFLLTFMLISLPHIHKEWLKPKIWWCMVGKICVWQVMVVLFLVLNLVISGGIMHSKRSVHDEFSTYLCIFRGRIFHLAAWAKTNSRTPNSAALKDWSAFQRQNPAIRSTICAHSPRFNWSPGLIKDPMTRFHSKV